MTYKEIAEDRTYQPAYYRRLYARMNDGLRPEFNTLIDVSYCLDAPNRIPANKVVWCYGPQQVFLRRPEISDKERHELAALAAGIANYRYTKPHLAARIRANGLYVWNPEHDDEDAFSLQVACNLFVGVVEGATTVSDNFGRFHGTVEEPHGEDPKAATRRAIFRAAVKIGEFMQKAKS